MPQVTQSFAAKVARLIGADPDAVYNILSQWQPYEGGDAAYNPLNTTQPGGEDPNNPYYNTFGQGNHVRNYASEDAGAQATAATLLNGNYPNLLNDLRTGTLTPLSAPDIAKWGTTGFAQTLAGGGGSTAGNGTLSTDTPSPTAPSAGGDNSGLISDLESRINALDQKLADLDSREPVVPGDVNDPTYADKVAEHDAWVATVNAYANQYNNLLARYTSLTGQKDTTFSNKLASQTAKLAWDQTNLEQAKAALDRYLTGQQNNTARANLIQQQKEDQIKYGTTGGKTSFSYNDLGSVFGTWASLLGQNSSSPLINYPGYTTMDVEGDLNRLDAQSGISGPAPTIPGLKSLFGDIPDYPLAGGGGGGATAWTEGTTPPGWQTPMAPGEGVPAGWHAPLMPGQTDAGVGSLVSGNAGSGATGAGINLGRAGSPINISFDRGAPSIFNPNNQQTGGKPLSMLSRGLQYTPWRPQ